jgi:hypothetical protein
LASRQCGRSFAGGLSESLRCSFGYDGSNSLPRDCDRVGDRAVMRKKARNSHSQCPHGDKFEYRNSSGRLVCGECARLRAVKRRIQNPNLDKQNRARLKKEVLDMLGNECNCCGSTENLETDHRIPTRKGHKGQSSDTNYREIVKYSERFQILCGDCNRWKADGPFCPCHDWDRQSPGWRTRTVETEI